MYKSQYATQYGHKEKNFNDPEILKYKKFSQMECAEVLNSKCIRYLDTWVAKGDEQDLISYVIAAVKSIYTRSRQNDRAQTAYKTQYRWFEQHQQVQQKRVDLVATNAYRTAILDKAARGHSMKAISGQQKPVMAKRTKQM